MFFIIFFLVKPEGSIQMKRKALITSALILCCWACCGFFCTTEWDMYQPCRLVVHMTPPKNVDAVHVAIYNDEEVYFELRDELIRPKSNPSDTFRLIRLDKDPDDFKNIRNWKFGKYFMAETVFCGNKKTIFPIVSFNVRKGRASTLLGAGYKDSLPSQSPNYDFASIEKDSTYYIAQRFIPLEDGCGIDSTYYIEIDYTELCHERGDNYLFN